MGVYRTDYLMFAVDVGADAFDWSKHETIADTGKPFQIVYDGMSGEYCYAGHLIAKSDPYAGHAKTEIDLADLGVNLYELAERISSAFGKSIAAGDFRLLLFSHFIADRQGALLTKVQ